MASVPIQQVAIISLLSQFNTIINRIFIFISLRSFGSCHLVDTDETTPYHFVSNNHGLVRFSIVDMAAKNMQKDANGDLTTDYLSLLF